MLLLLVAFVSLQNCVGSEKSVDGPVVVLPEFTATGVTLTREGELGVDAFFGLPYAQPPVGPLRLERPQPLPASDRKIVADRFGPACLHYANVSQFGIDTSEDCLYLNILTPARPPPNGTAKYAVLVWIHGGGFQIGGTEGYGTERFAHLFVRQGIVLVTIQYRLGFNGFLSLAEASLPGNLGLWDQVQALKFVKNRIAAFYGDPERITLWGHSAGSVSVHALSLSPHSRQLFHQGIQMSGSLRNPFGEGAMVVEHSKAVIKRLNCDRSDAHESKECLKKVSVRDLFTALAVDKRMRDDLALLWWSPILDADFFDGKSVSQLTAEAPPKRVVVGLTDGEAALLTVKTPHPITNSFTDAMGYEVGEQVRFGRGDFVRAMRKYVLTDARSETHVRAEAEAELLAFYLRNETVESASDPRFYFRKYTQLLSDFGLYLGILEEVREKSDAWTHFVFLFTFMRPADVPRFGWPQAPHGYEFQYLSDLHIYFPLAPSQHNAEEKRLLEAMGASFCTFVKTGNPSTTEFGVWPSVAIGHRRNPVRYMEFGKFVGATHGFFDQKMSFVEKFAQKYKIRLNSESNFVRRQKSEL